MNLQHAVNDVDGLTELSEDDWRALGSPAHSFASRAWLQASGVSAADVIVVRDGGRATLALPLFAPRHDLPPLHHPADAFTGGLAASLVHRSDRLEKARHAAWSGIRLAMSPYGFRSCLLGQDRSRAALGRLIDAAVARTPQGHGIAFPYLRDGEEDSLLAALLERGALPAVLGGGYAMHVRWSTVEEYFGWLGWQRKAVRRELRQGAPVRRARLLGCGDAVEPAQCERLAALLGATARRHGDTAPPEHLYRAVLGPFDAERILVWSEDEHESIQACNLGFVHDGILAGKFFGAEGRSGDYFPLVFSTMVGQAITYGYQAIDWSSGTPEAKLQRGGDLYWQTGAILSRDHGFLAQIRPWIHESNALVVSYLSELSERYSHDRRRPEPPRWMKSKTGGMPLRAYGN